ncbi:MAG: NAD(P)/FAD-dependent oxidoreductase [Halieaceae bacterium]|nr:NAD(P)/FAD-dependent oxidoreductase [Halieaceae bacterium]
MTVTNNTPATLDVLIVGAGLSGISAAVHLQREHPSYTFHITESRANIGGTWDLFKYPGIRSDSDMHTLGFDFKPWIAKKSIADGPAIKAYIEETVKEYGLTHKITLNQKVLSAAWDSASAQWTVNLESEGRTQEITCRFLQLCCGYYNYDSAYKPEYPGESSFTGPVIHPQFWDPNFDYTNKHIVVIGSGATAVTLVPSLAAKAAKVTMLQRSPTYMVSRPSQDGIANALRSFLPDSWAYNITRIKNIGLQQFIYQRCRKFPEQAKHRIIDMVRPLLPADYDVDKHFTPSYTPWEQRLCLVPDADMFDAIKSGKADIVTDTIAQFDETGIALNSGAHLNADVIISATGLELLFLGGIEITIDGTALDAPNRFVYKGCMLSGVPNMSYAMGYTNASWTLKCDLTHRYFNRLVTYMDAQKFRYFVPQEPTNKDNIDGFLDLNSGYIKRHEHELPKQASESPWKLHQNYFKDWWMFKRDPRKEQGLDFQ